MLIFLWAYVIVATVFPDGERMMMASARTIEAHMRAQLETMPAPRARIAPRISSAAAFAR
jgi:hypothetical protein